MPGIGPSSCLASTLQHSLRPCLQLLILSSAVLTAHARDELGIDPDDLANPVQVTAHGHNVFSIAAIPGCNSLYQHVCDCAAKHSAFNIFARSHKQQSLLHTGVGRISDQLLHRRRHPAAERCLHQGPHDQVGLLASCSSPLRLRHGCAAVASLRWAFNNRSSTCPAKLKIDAGPGHVQDEMSAKSRSHSNATNTLFRQAVCGAGVINARAGHLRRGGRRSGRRQHAAGRHPRHHRRPDRHGGRFILGLH